MKCVKLILEQDNGVTVDVTNFVYSISWSTGYHEKFNMDVHATIPLKTFANAHPSEIPKDSFSHSITIEWIDDDSDKESE